MLQGPAKCGFLSSSAGSRLVLAGWESGLRSGKGKGLRMHNCAFELFFFFFLMAFPTQKECFVWERFPIPEAELERLHSDGAWDLGHSWETWFRQM